MSRFLRPLGAKRKVLLAVAFALMLLAPIGVVGAQAAQSAPTADKVVSSKTTRCNVTADDARGSVSVKVSKYRSGKRYVMVDWSGKFNFEMHSPHGDRYLQSNPHYVKIDGKIEPKRVWSPTKYGFWSNKPNHYANVTWRIDDMAYGGSRYWYRNCQTPTNKL